MTIVGIFMSLLLLVLIFLRSGLLNFKVPNIGHKNSELQKPEV